MNNYSENTHQKPAGKDEWHPSSGKEPCPICGKSNGCKIANSGNAVLCCRIESGAKKNDDWWLHRLTNDYVTGPSIANYSRAKKEQRPARTLPLPGHFANLRTATKAESI